MSASWNQLRPLTLAALMAVSGVVGGSSSWADTGLAGKPVSEAPSPTTSVPAAMPPQGVVTDPNAIKDRTEKQAEVFNRVDVIEHRGDKLPMGLIFTNERGEQVTLGDYFKAGRPIILNLGYYECPMLCSLVTNGMNKAMKEINWVPGDQYQVISVSIDPTENYKLAQAKKQAYIEDFGIDAARKGWHFLTGDQDNITALAQAVGFKYEWVEKQMEFAHPAVIIVMTPDGTISRYLYGVEFPGNTLRLSLVEASQGQIGSALDKLILTCFHYDPEAGGYAVSAMKLMRLGGALTVLLVGLAILVMLLREWTRRRHAIKTPGASATM